MNIITESNILGIDTGHPLAEQFTVLRYQDGTVSFIPKGFFRDWLDRDIVNFNVGTFYIGQGSKPGVGSIVKYDGNHHSLHIGRYVDAGLRLKFLLGGQHEMGCISTFSFSVFGNGMSNPPMPQHGDMVIKNDIWIGDEAMFLSGCTIENGCVIGARTLVPPNFKTEPYGIYVGAPARLARFRFSEAIREALLALAWWEMPVEWIKQNNSAFLINLAKAEESQALDVLAQLTENKHRYLTQKNQKS